MNEPIDYLSVAMERIPPSYPGGGWNTVDLLRALTDEELEETAEHWDRKARRYAAAAEDEKRSHKKRKSPFASPAYAHWWCTKKQSMIYAERTRRASGRP
jgi:hypothetical protein